MCRHENDQAKDLQEHWLLSFNPHFFSLLTCTNNHRFKWQNVLKEPKSVILQFQRWDTTKRTMTHKKQQVNIKHTYKKRRRSWTKATYIQNTQTQTHTNIQTYIKSNAPCNDAFYSKWQKYKFMFKKYIYMYIYSYIFFGAMKSSKCKLHVFLSCMFPICFLVRFSLS